MLAQAVTGTPGHVNAMAASVGFFLEKFPIESMSEGDVYITNDPWKGTGHLNDFTVVTPTFPATAGWSPFSPPPATWWTSAASAFGAGRTPGLRGGHPHYRLFFFFSIMAAVPSRGKLNRTLMEILKVNVREPLPGGGRPALAGRLQRDRRATAWWP